MNKLLALSCLALSAFASADDAEIRSILQAKYASVDSAMKAGDMHSIAGYCDSGRFVATNIQKQRQGLGQYLRSLDKMKSKHLEIQTEVESGDTLNGMAKAALHITSTRVVIENGRSVTYKVAKTEEDTWAQDGDDWKLIGIRLTSNHVVRDGRTIVNESEKVLTDWDRQYGHRSSSRRRHG